MKNGQYSSGIKTAAMVLQMVFLIVVIVFFSLIVNLFGRSMLSFRDIGNNSFFDSYYYVEKMGEEMKELTSYLQLQMGMRIREEDKDLYKKYKLEFDDGDSNFYYWFSHGEKVYTNMGEHIKEDEALKRAKKFGSYLYYDDDTISFQGNIKQADKRTEMDMLRLFRNGSNGGGLVVAVDTALEKKDAIADAANVYDTYFPWVKSGLLIAIFSLLCFLICMIYITLATGRGNEDDKIRLHRIDYFPTEILLLTFIAFVGALIAFCARLGRQRWDVSSSLILTGTLVFLTDAVLLTLYLSFVRKIKADIFISCSLTAHVFHILKEGMRTQRILNRAVISFVGIAVLGLLFAWQAFANQHMWAIAGLFCVYVYLAVHFLQQAVQRKKILNGIIQISSGNLDYKFHDTEFTGDYKELAEKINTIGEGLYNAVEENVKNERLKTELITNVSHDIKTPLTSIINYINLIKLEKIQNEKLENYVDILEKKSLRLKQLMEDLVEVSKITSGNITLDMQPINMVELIYQTGGEFNEIFENIGLTIVTRLPKEPVMIIADGNRIWRVVQNLYSNVAKYAMKDTRVYVELKVNEDTAKFSIKDISAQEIHKSAQDLSERFVRGDESRGTEGNGLGLSIARNLTSLMGGTFEITLDGDLFTASITFPLCK